jgi:hypothetical protein
MDSHIFYDDWLTKIKEFNEYLTNIIDKGYNNNFNKLSLIVKNINNLNDDLIKLSLSMNSDDDNCDTDTEPVEQNSFKFYTEDKSSDSSSDTDDEAEFERKKELKKINNFIKNSDDLSNIYIYKNNNTNEMNKFIKKTLEY